MPVSFRVSEDDAGMRVDKLLRRELPRVPLSHIHKLLRTRKVRINDRRARGEDRLSMGDMVTVRGDPERLSARPLDVGRVQTCRKDFEVLYEDEFLLALSKPAGLAVHPGTGISGATLVDQVRAWLSNRAEEVSGEPGAKNEGDTPGFLPSPAHRLDKDTSGVVLVAKNRRAMAAMTELFTAGRVSKSYLALVKGRMPSRQGEISLPLEEHQQSARSKALHGRRCQPALTRWKLLAPASSVSLVEVDLGTGRTHQIRRHFSAVAHPVVGDRRYGDFPFNREAKISLGVERQMLHARVLSFEHPFTHDMLSVTAEVPADMRRVCERAGISLPG